MNRRLGVCLVSIIVVALALLPGASLAKQNGQHWITSESWTIAIFVSGDNNLEKYWDEASLPGLLLLPANPALTVVAYIDRLGESGTEIVKISGGEVEIIDDTIEEKNFGDGKEFQWFLEDVRDNFESDKLAVIAWDHGYAWRYISDDESSACRSYRAR